jgi:hypothetical protein
MGGNQPVPSAAARPSTDKTRCVVCKQEINSGAPLCPECKCYQSPWKNHLQYFAGVATLVVLTLAASSWVIGKVRAAYFYRNDVRVVECNTLGSAVIVNRGNGEVFLSHLLLWMPGRTSNWVAPEMKIDEKLSPGQFLSKGFPGSRIKGTAYFVRGLSSADFERLLARAANGDPCFEMAFFTDSDTDLRDIKIMAGPTLNTFNIAGYLEYWGSHSDSISRIQLTGTGMLRHDARAECK